jgi:hypothetical protein
VTLVQRSRVYYIEAEAPEGENVDSIANFFNAEAGDVMQVVSWTGDEVEYYNGILLSPRAVQQAFNLQQVPQATGLNRFARLDGGDDSENYLGTGKFILSPSIAGCGRPTNWPQKKLRRNYLKPSVTARTSGFGGRTFFC